MKKVIALLMTLVLLLPLVGCVGNKDDGKKSVGFVFCGMDGEFFQSLAETYKKTMEAEGWDAYYTDGKFDPATQIEAAENYIAMGVDVLVIWSVTGEAMSNVIDEAMAEGIKVISFVVPTEKYDVLMLSDDEVLAGYCAKVAARWIDKKFADQPDHSVPVAVLSFRTSDNVSAQADVLCRIEEFSAKAKFAKEVECTEESVEQGQSVAESLYLTDPDIKIFLTAQNPIANGVNAYYTGLSSPTDDYSDMGIFCINGDSATAENIQKSKDNGSPLRGTVMTGSVEDTANELRDMIVGLMDGSVESGHIQYAGTMFVYDETVDEYLEKGTVTSVSNADFD